MTLADEINLPLAPLDDPDKAFILKQQGVILGVDLTETTCWRIPADKVDQHRRAFMAIAESSSITRLEAERMLGMTQQVTNMLLEAVQLMHSGLWITVTLSLKATAIIWL